MPFTQTRAIYLINAARYYMNLINQARRKIESEMPGADTAARILDDSNTTEGEKRAAATRLWENYKQLADLISVIELHELAARDIITGEARYFTDAKLKENEYHMHYMRRKRESKIEAKFDDFTPTTSEAPINTTPRSAPEQEAILDEVQRDLYSDERESWITTDIEARIASKVPKQTATKILNQLVESGRVAYIKATNRYIPNNPNMETGR